MSQLTLDSTITAIKTVTALAASLRKKYPTATVDQINRAIKHAFGDKIARLQKRLETVADDQAKLKALQDAGVVLADMQGILGKSSDDGNVTDVELEASLIKKAKKEANGNQGSLELDEAA